MLFFKTFKALRSLELLNTLKIEFKKEKRTTYSVARLMKYSDIFKFQIPYPFGEVRWAPILATDTLPVFSGFLKFLIPGIRNLAIRQPCICCNQQGPSNHVR